MDPSWVILTICEPWEIGPNEAPPATTLQHSPAMEVCHLRKVMPAKFHSQPPSDAPGSGRRSGAAATVGNRAFRDFSAISGHVQPTHSSFPPFLDPLNSFPWSLFADSSPFESYDENKVGQQLDRVFRPPQRLLDQGNGIDEFLVSWAFH